MSVGRGGIKMKIYKIANNDFYGIQKITNFEIVSSSYSSSNPDEVIGGEILYDGIRYKFKYHHDFDNGNTYIVYDDVGSPKFYFALYYNESSGRMEKNENI
jgi:hypothetical protein